MTIQIGDRIPSATLSTPTADGPKPITTAEIFDRQGFIGTSAQTLLVLRAP